MKLIAFAVAMTATSVLAGFTVTATHTAVTVNGTPLDRYDLVAVNTGGDTGTQVKGLEYSFTGSRVFFEVEDTTDVTGEGDPDHIPDYVNFHSNTLTRIRVNNVRSSNVFVGTAPSPGLAQWNPYMIGLKQFIGAVANTGTTQATGSGYQIARFFMLRGGNGFFSGNLGGDVGSKVPFSLFAGPIPAESDSPSPQEGAAPDEPVVAVFGSDVSAGAPFSVTLSVGSINPANPPTLSTTAIPGIRDVSVMRTVNGSTAEYVVTGNVDYSRLYNPTIVPYYFNNNSSFPSDAFVVFAMPEPASVLGLLGTALCIRRRR